MEKLLSPSKLTLLQAISIVCGIIVTAIALYSWGKICVTAFRYLLSLF